MTENTFPKGILHEVNNAYPFVWSEYTQTVFAPDIRAYSFAVLDKSITRQMQCMCGLSHDEGDMTESFCFFLKKSGPHPQFIVPRESSWTTFCRPMASSRQESCSGGEDILPQTENIYQFPLTDSDSRGNTDSFSCAQAVPKLGVSPSMDMRDNVFKENCVGRNMKWWMKLAA